MVARLAEGRPVFTAGVFCLMLMTVEPASAQSPTPRWVGGLGIQAYPAGVIIDAGISHTRTHHLWGTHAGANFTNRRDWGKHDDERGRGAGVGLSWKYYLNEALDGLFFGLRTDVWFLAIDWKQNIGAAGSSDITVFQPVARIGYTYVSRNAPWVFDAMVSLGAEINIRTAGEPVGEGAILLVGIGAGYGL